MFRLPHSEISRVAHTEYIGVKSHPSVKVDRMTQAVIDQWRGKGADTMSIADREVMGLAGKLTMAGMMDGGQAQEAIIRYVASSWLSYLTRAVRRHQLS